MSKRMLDPVSIPFDPTEEAMKDIWATYGTTFLEKLDPPINAGSKEANMISEMWVSGLIDICMPTYMADEIFELYDRENDGEYCDGCDPEDCEKKPDCACKKSDDLAELKEVLNTRINRLTKKDLEENEIVIHISKKEAK